jgi:hypothetical protein
MTKTRLRGRYLVAAAAAFAAMAAMVAVALPAAAQTPTATQTTAATQTIHLTAGWNLVGWLHGTISVQDALAGGPNGPENGTTDVTADVDVVWGFDSASQTWSGYFPAATGVEGANDLEQLKSPNGYFIHATANVDWVVAS